MKTWKINDYDYFFSRILKTTKKDLNNSIQYEKDNYYEHRYEIDKKNGKRNVVAIDKSLCFYKIQKNLANNFLNNILLADNVYGFIKGYSYLDYLIKHKSFSKDKNYLRLDIKNFFGSITDYLVKDVLEYYIEINNNLTEENKEEILDLMLQIIFYQSEVIQGAVTSPVISNIIFRQLDLRIQKYCNKLDVLYTRYADDMLFSSNNKKVHSKSFLERIQEIINSKGFKLNYSKTIRTKGEISLNGYVVGRDIRISRKKLEDISRILFTIEKLNINKNPMFIKKLNAEIKNQVDSPKRLFSNKNTLINYLAGQRSFLISVYKKSEDKNFQDKLGKILKRIENRILDIYKTME